MPDVPPSPLDSDHSYLMAHLAQARRLSFPLLQSAGPRTTPKHSSMCRMRSRTGVASVFHTYQELHFTEAFTLAGAYSSAVIPGMLRCSPRMRQYFHYILRCTHGGTQIIRETKHGFYHDCYHHDLEDHPQIRGADSADGRLSSASSQCCQAD